MTFPRAKLPNWNLPTVRSLPHIPTVGCVSGNATSILGEQFGNLPDINALPHIKALNKVITEQIGTLLEGKLPDLPRGILFEARKVRLISELASIISQGQQLAAQIQAETNASIQFANEKIGELNAAKNEILSLPEAGRSVVQRKTLNRYNEYANELNAQIGRLQTTLGCLS